MTKENRVFALFAVMALAIAGLLLSAPVALAAPPTNTFKTFIARADPYVITQTMTFKVVTIEPGASLVADEGHALTLTVNGVEMGGVLKEWDGVDTPISAPGTYRGVVVLTVTEENSIEYSQGGGGPPPGPDTSTDAAAEPGGPPPPPPPMYFPFRQALYLDETGVVNLKSVLAAVIGKKPAAFDIKNIQISSKGENFDGIFVAGGEYSITNAKIALKGNGRSDFVGYGAAVVARGEDTRVVLDKVRIENKGVVRTGVVADKGSNVVVKNSYIQTTDGVLPEGYVPTIETTQMRSVPWMLSLSGNVRATNLLGDYTKASYINSYIGSTGWGVLSTDGCKEPILTAINSTIAITGPDGYGSYGIGDATEYFLGCAFDVPTYATISRGSYLFYGDSDPDVVAGLNAELDLGLTAKELARIPDKPTVVNSERFGVMWHGGGTLDISGGTVFNTDESTFLDKGQAIDIDVDGSDGVELNPGNGVLFQLMDDDDPGPVPTPDGMLNIGVYKEPTGEVTPQAGHKIYTIDSDDATATFSDIDLVGDFFNGMRGDIPGPFGPPSPRNLGLTFEGSTITGVITASTTHHAMSTIEAEDYRYLGEVTNEPSPAVNNGVMVVLAGASVWVVTETCYLTGLTVGELAEIIAPTGFSVEMTVDGTATDIQPGHAPYTGDIVLTLVAD